MQVARFNSIIQIVTRYNIKFKIGVCVFHAREFTVWTPGMCASVRKMIKSVRESDFVLSKLNPEQEKLRPHSNKPFLNLRI